MHHSRNSVTVIDMIKITNTTPTRPSEVKKKSSSSSTSSANFKDFLGETDGASETHESAEAQGINSFLFLQEVSDEQVQRQKALQQGKKTIQALEQLHRDLLLGRIPEATLKNLESNISRQRESFTDPRLKQLLDEIELRAAVELAKLERARAR